MGQYYAAMALPGSRLFKIAKENGTKLPESYEGYFSFADCIPLPTEKLEAYEILELRDQCFVDYFTNEKYLLLVKNLVKRQLKYFEMSKIKLKRKNN